MECLYCDVPLVHDGYTIVHSANNIPNEVKAKLGHVRNGAYMQRCEACGFKAALSPPPRACPCCGARGEWRDDHCATSKRS